jgi:hypothetical protein
MRTQLSWLPKRSSMNCLYFIIAGLAMRPVRQQKQEQVEL